MDFYNMLMAVVNTGDDAEPTKWIWIMVVVGVLLVVMAVISVVVSKKRNAVEEKDKTEDHNTQE